VSSHQGEYYDGEPDPAVVNEWHANVRAARLRELGLSYRGIGIVILEDFGVDRTVDGWRSQLTKQGCRPRPRGVHPRLTRA
jgi:hypothetical protein